MGNFKKCNCGKFRHGEPWREGDCRACWIAAGNRDDKTPSVVQFNTASQELIKNPIRSPACVNLQMSTVFDRRGQACVHKWVLGCDVKGKCTTGEKVDGVECCRTCQSYVNPDADGETSISFDRVVLINLKRRPDRLEEFRRLQILHGWELPEPTIFEAIDGGVVGVPGYYQAGAGAWGCQRSHVSILERAIMDGVQSLLVLEDDLSWTSDSWGLLRSFLNSVPGDWDQLMLGGQHIASQVSVSDGVVKCTNCQRTHAYAIRGESIKELLGLWYKSNTHIDHVMGPWHQGKNVYAPSRFIFGQSAGQSDISGANNPEKYWVQPSIQQPVLVVNAKKPVMELLRVRGFHDGRSIDPVSGYDVGLVEIAAASGHPRKVLIEKWLDTILWEASSMDGSVAAVWHPGITSDEIRSVYRGLVYDVAGETIDECLAMVPNSVKLRPNYAATHIVHLVADRRVAELLKPYGFHIGNWRCNISGHDHGLREISSIDNNPKLRAESLSKWVEDVSKEALSIVGGVAVVWHPTISVDELRYAAGGRSVVEIRAGSVKDVVRQFKSSAATLQLKSQ